MAHRKRNESGVALLLALFALFVVTSVGLGMLFLSDSETLVDANYRDEQSVYYASRAGLEEARDRMRWNAGSTINTNSTPCTTPAATCLPSAKPGTAGGVLYILNPTGSETVAPWNTSNAYFDDEICKEVSCGGAQTPPTSGWYVSPAATASSTYAASTTLPYKWMRITLKVDQSATGSSNVMYIDGNSSDAAYYACWNPSTSREYTSSTACAMPYKPVYLVTTLAITPSGSRRMLQYEVVQDSFSLSAPGALTMTGTGDTVSTASSSNYAVNGADGSGATCGGTSSGGNVPAVAVSDAMDQSTFTTAIPSNRYGNYTGTVGHATPDVEVPTMPSYLSSVSALNAFVSTIKASANQTLTGPVSNPSNLGTLASPQITVVNGDLTLSGAQTGYGILVVTGTYTAGGDVGWNGLVLVVGKGIITSGNGGGNATYNGAIIVAQTVNPSTGAPLATFGSPQYNWNGGGTNGIYYSSGCLQNSDYLADFKIVASHELLD